MFDRSIRCQRVDAFGVTNIVSHGRFLKPPPDFLAVDKAGCAIAMRRRAFSHGRRVECSFHHQRRLNSVMISLLPTLAGLDAML